MTNYNEARSQNRPGHRRLLVVASIAAVFVGFLLIAIFEYDLSVLRLKQQMNAIGQEIVFESCSKNAAEELIVTRTGNEAELEWEGDTLYASKKVPGMNLFNHVVLLHVRFRNGIAAAYRVSDSAAAL